MCPKDQSLCNELYDLIINIIKCLRSDDKENILIMYNKLTELMLNIINNTKINITEYISFFK